MDPNEELDHLKALLEAHPTTPNLRPPPQLPPIPFDPLPELDDATRRRLQAAALQANDRYVSSFLEEHSICPFARGGRALGAATRFVHFVETTDAEPFVELMARAASNPAWGVIQVILPMVTVAPEVWARFCYAVTAAANARLSSAETYAVAPLHPDLAFSLTNPFTLIPLFRRAPDPTIQWVRLDALEQIYAGRSAVDVFVAPEDIAAFLSNPRRTPLFDRIAETNRKMALRLGIDNVVRTLDTLRRDARTAYTSILLDDPEPETNEAGCPLHGPAGAASATPAAPPRPASPPVREQDGRWALVATRDLPMQTPRRFEVEGLEVVAVRTKDTVHVLYGRCPHRMGPLDEAIVEQDHLVCPFHGWDFRLDNGKSDGVPGESIHRFAAAVEDHLVWVDTAELRRVRTSLAEAFRPDDVLL